MNYNEFLQKYKRKFLKSELFLNWENDFVISNDDSPIMFVCMFKKNNEIIIGFKIGICRDEKYISVYWYGEEDKFFDMTNDGYQEAMHVLSFQLELFKKNNKYTY